MSSLRFHRDSFHLSEAITAAAAAVDVTAGATAARFSAVERETGVEEVNALLNAAASEGPLKGERSDVMDAPITTAVNGTSGKLYVWARSTPVLQRTGPVKDSLRDPKVVTGCLQQHRPNICHDDTLCVRRTRRKNYGDDVVKNSSAYKAGLNEVVERAEQMVRGATGREERAWARRIKERVIAFDVLSICDQRNLKASGRLEQTAAKSYTGSVVVDRMLADLVQGPESAELPGSPAGTVAAASASAPAGGHLATSQQLDTQGNGCAADRLSAAGRAVMDDMLATVDYSRPKVFELVCALAFMCGRSLAELMATGQFSAAERERERAPYPWVLFQASPSSKTEVILLLCGSHSFLNGLKRLRSMKQVASAASCKNINSRFCKSANTAAKTVLGVASSAFSDVRALYVGLTLALYGSAKTTSKQMTVADVAAAESEESEIEDVEAPAGGSCASHGGIF
ncbi:hypothetical protein JKP88DRAFT_289968 [Tribonema minus]|uniref:Telomere resolvase ResT/TelK catalytic domain-containing protein n=1 Tax=Tribonema minus TaxID=303371 RepID=A0A836CF72_9STRA|nr:hypothetical protein JKP88DRAFT_289968 [Tribonema minus]